MPTEPEPVTVDQVVHKAVESCGEGEGLDALPERFEDDDQRITAVADIEQLVDEAIGAIGADDPEPWPVR